MRFLYTTISIIFLMRRFCLCFHLPPQRFPPSPVRRDILVCGMVSGRYILLCRLLWHMDVLSDIQQSFLFLLIYRRFFIAGFYRRFFIAGCLKRQYQDCAFRVKLFFYFRQIPALLAPHCVNIRNPAAGTLTYID